MRFSNLSLAFLSLRRLLDSALFLCRHGWLTMEKDWVGFLFVSAQSLCHRPSLLSFSHRPPRLPRLSVFPRDFDQDMASTNLIPRENLVVRLRLKRSWRRGWQSSCITQPTDDSSTNRRSDGGNKMSTGGSQNSLRKALGAIKDSTTVGLAKVNSDYKELDIAIVRATNHVERPAKEKHIRAIFAAISATRPRADVAYCIHALSRRLAKTHNWAVALKTLIVIHRALREVDPTFREELINYGRSRSHMLNLAHFKDDSSPNAWDYSSWVRTYALFLEERLECFRVLKYDVDTDPPRMRDLDTADMLEQMPALQQLLFRVLGCQYKGATFGELSPHLFVVADACYRALINEHGSQSILVSGECGAGKTETTKMLMNLAFMGGRSGTEGRTVEQQVLESNPVLEAFGNAKTVKNNNSSRFGKFVEIQFDKRGKISGAAVRTYLLERSRVCQVSDPERNYHCFYMLCSAPPEDVKKYKVGDPKQFHYLNQTSCYEVANVNDAREYLETRNAMDIVGIGQEEQDAIFRVVAAILHLGNINFVKGKEIDSSKLKDDKSLYHLRTAAELFMCDETALEDSLTKRVIVTPDGNIIKLLDPVSAASNRDALAKTVYSRLFDWLVEKINNSIGQDPNVASIIGVLDIYGFESFKINSFEQLCINLTNEKLQQHFNQHVFKMEQEEYTKEEINWSYVEFVDNQDVLDLIEKAEQDLGLLFYLVEQENPWLVYLQLVAYEKAVCLATNAVSVDQWAFQFEL